MFTIGFFAQKGGPGKTTLSIHASVQAAELYRVFVGDADGQESLWKWGKSRPFDTPTIERVSGVTLKEKLVGVAGRGFELAIVDCPPHGDAWAAKIAEALDFAVVPCRPSRLDLEAVGDAVRVLEGVGVPYVFVLNQARAQSTRKNASAIKALSSWGPVCPFMVPRLDAYEDALNDGRAVTEFAPGGKAADAVRAAWGWIFQNALSRVKP
ncbi:ParA family protein [Paraburkholderia sp. RL18-103-BIB-C]|uniref:nucleotide-binding protein n=1 Tax=Paraburkholderia sp. RL18-103-BIB-C TaxID=3031637 RepID=UPI0038BCB7F8